MDKRSDRDLLIEVHTDVKHIKTFMPDLVKRVNKHEWMLRIIYGTGTGLFALFIAFFDGSWELLRGLFKK